jgi:PmbA protein
MIRFSNNSITVSNTWISETPTVYLVSERRRAACVVEEQNPESITRAVEDLAKAMSLTPKGNVDFRFPKGPFKYQGIAGTYDENLDQAETELIDAVETGVNAAKKEGAVRVSGVLTSRIGERYVLTSEGAEGADKTSEIGMTIRAFAADDASGQGVTLATNLRQFNPEEAGITAAHIARMALNPEPSEPGKYDVVFGPSIFANLMNRVSDSTSAYLVDLGLSFFQGKLKEKVGSELVTVMDNPRLERSPGSTPLDDEGFPTQENCLIGSGVLETFLHTSYTAAEQKSSLTGSASFEAGMGGIVPAAHNVIVKPGESTLEELIDKAHNGLYITNNWYTRFQNYRTGDFSTIIRDGAFRIANGKISHPLKGLRLSDNIIRILQSVNSLSRTQEWIKWWEVDTPTLTPCALAENVGITTASK